MNIYIVLYLFLLLILLFKKSKFIYFALYTSLILIGGLRDVEVGTDTESYLEIYNYIETGGDSLLYALTLVEPGWFFINWLCAIFEYNYQGVLFLSIIIAITPIFIRAWQYGNRTHEIIFFYVALFFYINSFNIIRQIIAVSFVFYGFHYLNNNKNKSFYYCICFATLFHYTAILCSIIPFLVKKVKLSIFYIFLILIGSYIAGLYIIPFILPQLPLIGKYSIYLIADGASGSISRILLNLFFIFVFVSCNLKRNKLYNSLFFIGVVIYNLLAFSPSAARLALYFTISQIILFPQLTSKYKWNKIIIKVCAILYASIYYITMLNVNSGEVVPYKTFWE